MSKPLKLACGLALLVVLLVAGLYAYRSLMLFEGETPEGFKLLTAIPDSTSFEPRTLPARPVLANRSPSDVAVDFGYKVGEISYSYSLQLTFPPDADQGKATVTARHATRDASVATSVSRRWDEPRKAYAVALAERFDIEPAVPSLCIKAVIGPQRANYDLRDASICIAQRDSGGNCHPETLACGLIRK